MHDVYVAHAPHHDGGIADVIVEALEANGVRCWIAPRDIVAGLDSSSEIAQAIASARVFVLIFSSWSNTSMEVLHDVKAAAKAGAAVVRFRVDDIVPEGPLADNLRGTKCVDALSPDLSHHVDELMEVVALYRNASPAPAYDVFISAKTADRAYAEQVWRHLTSHGLTVFFSPKSLPDLGSSDYRREIDRALDKSKHMIVVTSSYTNVMERWVEAEWGMFINEMRSGRKRGNLVTMIVGDLRPGDLPPSLRNLEVLDFSPDAFERLLRYLK